ncbi:hypothetical protein SEA_CECE_322 [Microbacterium phage Cece]|nr:hypothetical protein SEA_CECE_20 [Microbacterium phage Cece]UVG35328.1 hypothetical protein SEA_CECE_322 [Microbacterium phage Cece]
MGLYDDAIMALIQDEVDNNGATREDIERVLDRVFGSKPTPIVFQVKVELTNNSPQARAAFEATFTEYLTEKDAPFLTDYGRGTWGGYEGPYVTSVDVTRLFQ